MARSPRVHFPGALYHVISRGNQRQKVFKDAQDYRRFETLLREAGKRHSLTLYAYVLMPNHIHLLLEVSRTPLSKAMQSLLYRYTRHHNRQYRKVGHLFQGRYKAILCDRDNYLMELIRYLHLNPVRAGMVRDPTRYRWSSHGQYLRGKSDSALAVDKGLQLWGVQRGAAIKAYEQFIRDGLEQGHRAEYYDVKEQQYLGEDKFVEAVQRTLEQEQEAQPVKITMEEVLREVIRGSEKEIGVILGKGRGRIGSRLRAEAAYVGREVGGIRLTEAARYLRRDLSTVSLAVKRLEEHIQNDSQVRRRLQEVGARLRRGRARQYQRSKA
ncbi:MAG: transposase [Deltaproteobacteria bacterium]|nr:transposase [Deltaproteobacteria bacterium]